MSFLDRMPFLDRTEFLFEARQIDEEGAKKRKKWAPKIFIKDEHLQ